MVGNLVNLVVWLLVAAWLIAFGWDEPLRYRFLSREAKEAEQKALMPTPRPKPDYRNWDPPQPGPGTLGHPVLGGHGLRPTAPPRH